MTRTFAAAIFALLAVTAPLHAATIQWDLSGVTAPGVTVTGFFDYDTVPCCSAANFPDYNLTLTGAGTTFTFTPFNSYLEETGSASLNVMNNGVTITNIEDLGLSSLGDFGSTTPTLSLSNSIFFIKDPRVQAEGTLNGELIKAPVSPVPLPAAFPLFGSALAGLGGFGWLKRRGKVSRPDRN
jgi:hypothetical protein